MAHETPKFVFITGGVVSALGKGLAAASVGALLEARGLKVAFLKLDPYINVDPGTMSPFQHGEVFVTDDGAEADLDLGHYERFTSARMTQQNNCTSGRIYQRVIERERRGDYLGGTVQVIPHITDEIKRRIMSAADGKDLLICEIGGTVGDIESLPFLEAIRQVQFDVGKQRALYVHLTLVPFIKTAGEVKTKPSQHSVKELRAIGISPDILLCRAEQPLGREVKEKLALFSSLPCGHVFTAADVQDLYALPLALYQEGLDQKIVDLLDLGGGAPALGRWQHIVAKKRAARGPAVRVAIVGKYTDLSDAYKSLNEALQHGALAQEANLELVYVDSETLERGGRAEALLGAVDGILVPGGFGERGVEGKVRAIRWAREHKVPFFGICLGLQLCVLEFARNVAGIERAQSQEFDPAAPDLVIALMEGQKGITRKGGTMRLGSYPCTLVADSLARRAYGQEHIDERHRHRFEVNPAYRKPLEAAGLSCSGLSPDGRLVEIVELALHPWFLACQFHPEFQSQPFAPHPLFAGFVEAARAESERRQGAVPQGHGTVSLLQRGG
jgi:CTP synthase